MEDAGGTDGAGAHASGTKASELLNVKKWLKQSSGG